MKLSSTQELLLAVYMLLSAQDAKKHFLPSSNTELDWSPEYWKEMVERLKIAFRKKARERNCFNCGKAMTCLDPIKAPSDSSMDFPCNWRCDKGCGKSLFHIEDYGQDLGS